MLFVGIDALPQEGVAYVRQGILDATFHYPTGGAEAIDTALKILQGETVPKNRPGHAPVRQRQCRPGWSGIAIG